MNHRYIAGPAEKLAGLFPQIKDQDKRQLEDGNVIVEVDLDDFKLASMEARLNAEGGQADADLTVMTHEEAIEYVGQFNQGEQPNGGGQQSVATDAGDEATGE